MVKKIKAYIKLEIPAGQANPSPPVGPALGQQGLNIMDFCKAFNEQTKELQPGQPVPVVITAFEDRSFSFITKTPPVAYLLRQAAKIKKGSGEPNKNKVGRVSNAQVKQIAEVKMKDLNAIDMEGAMMCIKGSARSMGIEVEG